MKKIITIDEIHTMSISQLDEFIDNSQKLIEEGIISESESNVDLMGMSPEEIRKKYGYTPMDEFFNELEQKLMSRNGSTEYDRAKGI